MHKNIIFDFDGVILDSVPIKTEAFRKLFINFPKNKVDSFIDYHQVNGGISRFVKIRYFFEELMEQSISEEQVLVYAKRYSELTKEELASPKYLIMDSLTFIKENVNNYSFHIASGADENDLKYICERLELTNLFLSIHGSPKTKSDIIGSIMAAYDYEKSETCMVGDSFNDYEAAVSNGIAFYGYNNAELRLQNCIYLSSMNDILPLMQYGG